jgi:hypothetical protein
MPLNPRILEQTAFVKVIVVVKAPLGCRWSLNAQQRDSGGSKLTE